MGAQFLSQAWREYDNDAVRNKFAKADTRPADRKLDYRGQSGDQVLKPGKGASSPATGAPISAGLAERPISAASPISASRASLISSGKADLGKPG